MATTTSRSLWEEAHSSLSDKQKQVLSFQPSGIDPQDLLDTVRQQFDAMRAKRLRVRLPNGENFIFHDAYFKLSTWIQRFIEVRDVAVQYDSGHAALPWAAVRFILKVRYCLTSDNSYNGAALIQHV